MNHDGDTKFLLKKTDGNQVYYGSNLSSDDDSSTESDSWHESHSSCSSDSSSYDGSLAEWESDVGENGELFYVRSNPEAAEGNSEDEHSNSQSGLQSTGRDDTKRSTRGKLVRLIRHRESKRHRQKTGKKENEQESSPPFHQENEKETTIRQVELYVDPWIRPNLGRRATLSETLLGLVTATAPDGCHVLVSNYVPDGIAAKQNNNIVIGDWLLAINGKEVTASNLQSILAAINTPSALILKLKHPEYLTPSSHSVNLAKPKYQSHLAERLVSYTCLKDQLKEILNEAQMAVLYLQLDGLIEGGEDDQGIVYSYPPLQSNCLWSVKGAFLTLHHLLPTITHSAPVSSSIAIKGQLTHVLYKQEGRELLLLAVPHKRCPRLEAIQFCDELVQVLQFKYQSLSRCFSTHSFRPAVDHIITLFMARLLDPILDSCLQDFTIKSPQFESLLPAAHLLPLPRETQIQIDDALSELESNDLGDMCDDHDCQRLYTILGTCLYHKGHLLASHLPHVDLIDIHLFCRQQGLLSLTRLESLQTLVVWHEVFPASVFRGQEDVKIKTDSIAYSTPEGRWFLLIVGQKHDMLVVLLESGGCSSRADGNPGPDVLYVEAAQDTLHHIQKTGISTIVTKWIESNLRPEVVTPESVAHNVTSPRRFNSVLGLKISHDSSSRQGLNYSSSTKKSTELSKRRASPDLSTIHSGSGPLHGDTSEDSASLVASLPSDELSSVRVRREEREIGRADQDVSDDSDSDWECRKATSLIDFSLMKKSLVHEIEETVPSKLTMGPENLVFHYVHVDVSEGILLSPFLTSPSNQSPCISNVLRNFRRCALQIHMLLQNAISFKKLKGVKASQSLINKSLVAINEFGALFECHIPTRGGEKPLPPLTYWVVGRLYFMPHPREVYICYYDAAPQNMVEIAFKLALTTFG